MRTLLRTDTSHRQAPSALAKGLTGALLLLLLCATVNAEVITTAYRTEVSTHSWRPIPLRTVSRLVEAQVLQALTKSGRLSLVRAKKQDGLTGRVLSLKISARIIEDAAQFSVFLQITPAQKLPIGALASVVTRSIYRMDHKAIHRTLARTAQQAAAKLEAVLNVRLDQLAAGDDALKSASPASGVLPVDWGQELRAAKRSRIRGAESQQLRQVETLSLAAEKRAAARLTLAHCALASGKLSVRISCIDALAQLAKTRPFAQRALIATLVLPPPKDDRRLWREARRKAFMATTTFEGVALEEALQAWLHIFSADYSLDYQLFGGRREEWSLLDPIADYLMRRSRPTPNLEIALAACSRPSKKGRVANDACLKVMRLLPARRRLRLLYRQLALRPAFDTRETWRGWTKLFETAIEGVKALPDALQTLCAARIQRSFTWRDRADCVEALAQRARPTAKLVDFLVNTYRSADSSLIAYVDRGLWRLAQRQPTLCARIKQRFSPLLREGGYPIYRAFAQRPDVLKRCEKQRTAR